MAKRLRPIKAVSSIHSTSSPHILPDNYHTADKCHKCKRDKAQQRNDPEVVVLDKYRQPEDNSFLSEDTCVFIKNLEDGFTGSGGTQRMTGQQGFFFKNFTLVNPSPGSSMTLVASV